MRVLLFSIFDFMLILRSCNFSIYNTRFKMHETLTCIYYQGSVVVLDFYGIRGVSIATTTVELKTDYVTALTRQLYISCVKYLKILVW